MESQSELVGGEQNGQTVQPLVTNQNDRNVKSLVATKTKRARNPGKDKKYHDKKKLKMEDTERQLEKTRADHAELKEKYDELKNTHAYSVGKLDQAKEDMELVKGCCSLMQQVVTQQHAWINMLQPLNVEQPGLTYGGLTYGGDLNYTSPLGATMVSGSWSMQGSLAPGGQGNNNEQPTSYNADQFPGVN